VTAPVPSFARFGVAVGHATDDAGATGLTVVRGVDGPLHAGVAVLGRASATRELPTASPSHLVDRVDAVLLTGGSAYGLDAAAGVMQWLEERGRGFPVGPGVVPIVPAAALFDLAPLGSFAARPTRAMAYAACDAASPDAIAEGSVGAGTGCTVGKVLGPGAAMKGGIGASVAAGGDAAVGALAAVNALGDVRDERGTIVAGARAAGGFADGAARLAAGGAGPGFGAAPAGNTTLAVVVTDVPLGREELAQLAAAAGTALARRITPCGTSFDGDVVFALGPVGGDRRGRVGAPPRRHVAGGAADDHHPQRADRPTLLQLEALALSALEEAVERAVRTARGRDGVPGLADQHPAPPGAARG
jgi:L-aminopeptidase/D-esterase-like protein